MKNAALITLFAAALIGCASPGGRNGPYLPITGSTYERQVIGALGETKVNAEQRQAVLAAYDVMAPLLKQNDADDLRVQRRWEALDPHTADYQAQVDAVALQAANVAANRLKALAQFNQAVAATLDNAQWSRWSLAMHDERAAFENARRLDPTFRPGER